MPVQGRPPPGCPEPTKGPRSGDRISPRSFFQNLDHADQLSTTADHGHAKDGLSSVAGLQVEIPIEPSVSIGIWNVAGRPGGRDLSGDSHVDREADFPEANQLLGDFAS